MTNRFANRLTRRAVVLLLAIIGVGISISARAEDRLATIFQDNMVLQRDKPVPVWGWADPGTQVEVSFGEQKKQAKADEHGYWKAVLDPLPANRTPQVLTAQIGSTTISRKNVLVGEVWFTTGHSNTMAGGPDFDTGVYPHYVSPGTKGGKPEIRIVEFGFGGSLVPYDDIDPMGRDSTHWKVLPEDPTPAILGPMDYFARVVRDGTDVPVGIVHMVLVTATGQSTWTQREVLESFPDASGKGNFYQEVLAQKNEGLVKSHNAFGSWDDFKKAEDAWRESKTGPWPGNVGLNCFPTMGYNTRLYPLHPFAVRGAVFFAICGSDHGVSAPLVVAMLKQWRELFAQDLYLVVPTNMRYTTPDQPPLTPCLTTDWLSDANEAVRHAALLFKDDKKVAVVEQNDLGDWVTHFLDKAEMGRRLGLAALTVAYGQNNNYTGPQMVETRIEGNKATVRFEHVGDGIVYQPSIDGISGVCLLGKSGKSQWGQVNIVGKDTVEFSSPDIPDLAGIAYGENANPHETLFNSDASGRGLPASPFTTIPTNGGTAPKFQIASMPGEDKNHSYHSATIKEARISLVHVRRSGYVFQIIGQESVDLGMKPVPGTENLEQSSASVPIEAYIPAEWKGYEVVTGDKNDIKTVNGMWVSKGVVATGGKPITTTETTKDGAKFINFNAPVDGTWVIVAETGKAADFAKVNRY
jgi:sialate O-acetylesterase